MSRRLAFSASLSLYAVFRLSDVLLMQLAHGLQRSLATVLVSNMCLLRPHRRRLVSDSSVVASVKRLHPEEFSPVLLGRAISKANPCLRSWNRAIRNRFSLSATWLIASGGASAPIHRWVWWRRPGGLQLGPQFGPERGHRGSGRCPTLCAAILFVQRLEMSPKPWADVLNRELRYGLGKGERPQSFAGIGPSWLR